MPSKKTGLYISAINEPIINEVMKKYNYTKISNCINFIIQEYSRLSKENKAEVAAVVSIEENPRNINDWFVLDEE